MSITSPRINKNIQTNRQQNGWKTLTRSTRVSHNYNSPRVTTMSWIMMNQRLLRFAREPSELLLSTINHQSTLINSPSIPTAVNFHQFLPFGCVSKPRQTPGVPSSTIMFSIIGPLVGKANYWWSILTKFAISKAVFQPLLPCFTVLHCCYGTGTPPEFSDDNVPLLPPRRSRGERLPPQGPPRRGDDMAKARRSGEVITVVITNWVVWNG